VTGTHRAIQSFIGLHAFGYLLSIRLTPRDASFLADLFKHYDPSWYWTYAMMFASALQLLAPWFTKQYRPLQILNVMNLMVWLGAELLYVRHHLLGPSTISVIIWSATLIVLMIVMKTRKEQVQRELDMAERANEFALRVEP
jgi:hypothetical protein